MVVGLYTRRADNWAAVVSWYRLAEKQKFLLLAEHSSRCGYPDLCFLGTSTMNQLERILELTGCPSTSDVEAMQSVYAGTMLESLVPRRQK